MLMDFDHLSIWEIAHRWHGVDPNTSDPETLPLPVQDLLRVITNMQLRHLLPVLTKSGTELKSERNFPPFSEYLATEKEPENPDDRPLWYTELKESYFEQKDKWCRRHDEATEGLEKCFKYRVFNKEQLESIHLDRGIIAEFCREKSLELPQFWFTDRERADFLDGKTIEADILQPEDNQRPSSAEETETVGKADQAKTDRFWGRLTNAQRHRLLCREVATKLWQDNNSMTQTAIMDHDVIQEFCGAKFYSDPNTVRNWIKDLDPRPANKRRGRPKS